MKEHWLTSCNTTVVENFVKSQQPKSKNLDEKKKSHIEYEIPYSAKHCLWSLQGSSDFICPIEKILQSFTYLQQGTFDCPKNPFAHLNTPTICKNWVDFMWEKKPNFSGSQKNNCVGNKELRTLKNEILHLPFSARFLRLCKKTLLLIWMHQLFGRIGQISEEQRNPVFQDTKKKTNCCVANKALQTLKLKFL